MLTNDELKQMNGFDLVIDPGLKLRKNTFIPFAGWEGYKQSDMLTPWPKTTLEKVKYKTGIDFPEGTKGFPLELLFFIWKDHEFFLADYFDTRVSNKMEIGAKDVLKTGFMTTCGIFNMVNFDFAENMSMMKYQNQLYQVPQAVLGYMDLIEEKTGLRLHSCFDLDNNFKFDEKVANIKFNRPWYKTYETTTTDEKGNKKTKIKNVLEFNREWLLRSFDKPHKIANTPLRQKNGCINFVNIIEAAMFDDPGDISASTLINTWSVNKSSLFRYARDLNLFAQMLADLNAWDEYHDFIIVAEEIVPYNFETLEEKKTIFGISEKLNWRIRRLTRFANTKREMTPDEWTDYLKEQEENNNLWKAKYWGATFSLFGKTPFTYLQSMKHIDFVTNPTPEQLLNLKDDFNKEKFIMHYGIDFGTNHATSLKKSIWIPSLGTIVRHHIWRICNQELKLEGQQTASANEILNLLIEQLALETKKYIEAGFKIPITIFWDQGSWAMGEIFLARIKELELDNIWEILPGLIHKENGRSEKIHFDNFCHSSGMIKYTPASEVTIEQYKRCLNKKSNSEEREEKNQLLDEIDATNIAETEIRFLVNEWLARKIVKLGKE